MAKVVNRINIGGGGTTITVVANYSALPDPTTVSGKFYWCSASQGTSWLPGKLGGTYYSAGQYYSNGTDWEFIEVPYQATQVEVDAGSNTDKFLTPNTFKNASKWSNFFPLSSVLGVSNGGTNADTQTAPSGGICPLVFFDGTKMTTDSIPDHLGYDESTDTVHTSHVSITTATSQRGLEVENTVTSGPASGGGIGVYSNDGSPMSLGDRLGYFLFGGNDGTTGKGNSAGFSAFATSLWSSINRGSKLVFGTTPDNETARANALTIDQDQKLILHKYDVSTVPYLDANKKLQSSSVTPTELGLLSGKTALLSGFIYKTTTTVAITGTTSEAEAIRIEIPANSFSASDDIMALYLNFSKSGTAGNCTWKMKMSTSATMPSGTTSQIGTGAVGNTVLYAGYLRMAFPINGGNIYGFPFTTTTGNSDLVSSVSPISSQAFDVTVTNYLYISFTNGSSADTVTLRAVKISNL